MGFLGLIRAPDSTLLHFAGAVLLHTVHRRATMVRWPCQG